MDIVDETWHYDRVKDCIGTTKRDPVLRVLQVRLVGSFQGLGGL